MSSKDGLRQEKRGGVMKIYGSTKYVCDWCSKEAIVPKKEDHAAQLVGWFDMWEVESVNRDTASRNLQCCAECVARLGSGNREGA